MSKALEERLEEISKTQRLMFADIQVTKNTVEFIKSDIEQTRALCDSLQSKYNNCPARINEVASDNNRPKYGLVINIALAFLALGSFTVALAAFFKG